MKKATIITVRSNSKRLPLKILKKIKKNHKSIDVVIKRSKKIKLPIIIATTRDKSDDKLVEYIKQNYDCKIYRGNIKNKVSRWFNCMKFYNLDSACFVDGDDLAFDYDLFKKTIKKLNTKSPTIYKFPTKIVTGIFTYCINFEALKILFLKSKKYKKLEIIDNLVEDKKIKVNIVNVSKKLLDKNIRLTLDYNEDLILFRKIFKIFPVNATSSSIIEYMLKHKDFCNINFFLNKNWKTNQKQQTKK
ncbi:cytidylyltransferase domain-containing protein [Candidatus Pelagibacter sp. HIMB1593]|uniref:cytidylyltransferase domain-containing protein n=1 Tax=Candidatus Pelagibacter sp. HIMB1593 TaxID=3413355 RepID=UPI003F87C83F